MIYTNVAEGWKSIISNNNVKLISVQDTENKEDQDDVD